MTDHADNPVLKIEGLRVVFPGERDAVNEVVRGINFEIRRGRTLAVVGESGSGKSVTAYAILRLIQKPGRITGGRIQLHPKSGAAIDILALPERSPLLYKLRGGWVSMIYQEPMSSLSPVHTIGDQITEAILIHQPVTRREADRMAVAALGEVGIPEPEIRFRQYPFELSGGMRQRVVIAMALVCRPDLLIADEPTTALDVTVQAQILTLLRELRDRTGASILFITHNIGVVAQIADDVCVMYGGQLLEKGTVRQVLKDPRHVYTRGLLAAIPGLHSRRSRLPTIDSVVGDVDLRRPVRLQPMADGREIAVPIAWDDPTMAGTRIEP